MKSDVHLINKFIEVCPPEYTEHHFQLLNKLKDKNLDEIEKDAINYVINSNKYYYWKCNTNTVLYRIFRYWYKFERLKGIPFKYEGSWEDWAQYHKLSIKDFYKYLKNKKEI